MILRYIYGRTFLVLRSRLTVLVCVVVAVLSPYAVAIEFEAATQLSHNTVGVAEASSSISTDNLSLYFSNGDAGLSVMTRMNAENEFGPPSVVSELPTLNHPELSRDGLTLYGNLSGGGIVSVQRDGLNEPFAPSTMMTLFDSPAAERWPTLSADQLEIFYTVGTSPDYRIWTATRTDLDASFGSPMPLPASINTGSTSAPDLSADGLTLFFTSERDGGFGSGDIWISTRPSTNDAWNDPFNAGPSVNSAGAEWQPDFSADGNTLFFSRVSDVANFPDYDLWHAQVVPEASCGIAVMFAVFGVLIKSRSLRRK